MIYNPPHKEYASKNLDTAATIIGTAGSVAVPVSGAIAGGIATGSVAGAIGGISGATGAAMGATATSASLATGASAIGSAAGATAATGIGIPVAIGLALVAAGVGVAGAVKKKEEKQEAQDYDNMFENWQSAKKNSELSYKQNLAATNNSYNQNGINQSISAIDKMTTFSSSLTPSTKNIAINNNRLI